MSTCNKYGPKTTWVSWKVRGLNIPIKCNKVFVHLLNKDHNRLRRAGFTQLHHSNFNAKCRGVAILIHRDVLLEETSTIRDKNSCVIIVQGNLFGIPVVLANIYALNWDNMQFFKDFFCTSP